MESRVLASQLQSGNSRAILKQQHQNHLNVIPSQDSTLIGKNSKYVVNGSFNNSVVFQPMQKQLAYPMHNSALLDNTMTQSKQSYESHLSTPVFQPSLRNSCYTSLQSSVGPQVRSKVPNWPEEQLVVVNNLTFIAYKEQSRSISKEKTKIINLKSRSKQKKSVIIKQQSKSLVSEREVIITNHIASNRTPVASSPTPSLVVVRQATPQKTLQNVDQQSLLRKLRIFQNRLTELHMDKQKGQIKLQQITMQFTKQLNDKNLIITNLQEKLRFLCSKYEQRDKQTIVLQEQLWRQRQQNQKLKEEISGKGKVEMSTTTQNFINLTLSEQLDNLSDQNAKLKKEIEQLNMKNLELRNASLNKRWQNIINKPESVDLPLMQDGHEGQVTQVVPINWGLLLPQSSRSMAQSQRIFQISKDEIMSVDSQHMQVDQIIHNIRNISSQNDQLKLQLQEKKNEIQIKDMVAMETARIVQEIKDAVSQSNCHKQSNFTKIDELEQTKKSIDLIKEILAQFQ